MPLILFARWRGEKHTTYWWLSFKKKKPFLWWGYIVVNFMLITKCLLNYIWASFICIPVLLCAWQWEASSKNYWWKMQSWEMNHKGSSFASTATCVQGISPPTVTAEQSRHQDKTAVVVLVPWCEYIQPSCFQQVYLQCTSVNHFVF